METRTTLSLIHPKIMLPTKRRERETQVAGETNHIGGRGNIRLIYQRHNRNFRFEIVYERSLDGPLRVTIVDQMLAKIRPSLRHL